MTDEQVDLHYAKQHNLAGSQFEPPDETEKDDRIGNMLYNALESLGADTICQAMTTNHNGNVYCSSIKCDECPFHSQKRLESELTALEID